MEQNQPVILGENQLQTRPMGIGKVGKLKATMSQAASPCPLLTPKRFNLALLLPLNLYP